LLLGGELPASGAGGNYPMGNQPFRYPCDRRLNKPHRHPGCGGEEINPRTLTGSRTMPSKPIIHKGKDNVNVKVK
jgi:hypothetical protein